MFLNWKDAGVLGWMEIGGRTPGPRGGCPDGPVGISQNEGRTSKAREHTTAINSYSMSPTVVQIPRFKKVEREQDKVRFFANRNGPKTKKLVSAYRRVLARYINDPGSFPLLRGSSFLPYTSRFLLTLLSSRFFSTYPSKWLPSLVLSALSHPACSPRGSLLPPAAGFRRLSVSRGEV